MVIIYAQFFSVAFPITKRFMVVVQLLSWQTTVRLSATLNTLQFEKLHLAVNSP